MKAKDGLCTITSTTARLYLTRFCTGWSPIPVFTMTLLLVGHMPSLKCSYCGQDDHGDSAYLCNPKRPMFTFFLTLSAWPPGTLLYYPTSLARRLSQAGNTMKRNAGNNSANTSTFAPNARETTYTWTVHTFHLYHLGPFEATTPQQAHATSPFLLHRAPTTSLYAYPAWGIRTQ